MNIPMTINHYRLAVRLGPTAALLVAFTQTPSAQCVHFPFDQLRSDEGIGADVTAIFHGTVLRLDGQIARRQLLLPVDDNYFCRRRVSKVSAAGDRSGTQ